jgi:transposase-like protein
MKKQPTYTEQFKKDVLAYWADSEKSGLEVAKHFGVSDCSLYTWRKRYGLPQGGKGEPSPGRFSDEGLEAENRYLREQLADYQLRCEILKKTLGIVSEPSGTAMKGLKR